MVSEEVIAERRTLSRAHKGRPTDRSFLGEAESGARIPYRWSIFARDERNYPITKSRETCCALSPVPDNPRSARRNRTVRARTREKHREREREGDLLLKYRRRPDVSDRFFSLADRTTHQFLSFSPSRSFSFSFSPGRRRPLSFSLSFSLLI